MTLAPPLRDAVVLAAGLGTRIRPRGDELPKPLQQVAGRTLLERTLATLAAAGVERAVVVVGFRGDEIRRAAQAMRPGLVIEFVDNPTPELGNGVSVLCGAQALPGPYVLSMSDHVYDREVADRAARASLADAELVLCVDRRVTEIYDLPDATKVATDGDRIVAIGKTLEAYDCVDCGVFAVGPGLAGALAAERAARGDCSLSDGVRRLAELRRARVVDIGAAFWQDVDTPGALERAEQVLAQRRT